jgi:hypothetical protein
MILPNIKNIKTEKPPEGDNEFETYIKEIRERDNGLTPIGEEDYT